LKFDSVTLGLFQICSSGECLDVDTQCKVNGNSLEDAGIIKCSGYQGARATGVISSMTLGVCILATLIGVVWTSKMILLRYISMGCGLASVVMTWVFVGVFDGCKKHGDYDYSFALAIIGAIFTMFAFFCQMWSWFKRNETITSSTSYSNRATPTTGNAYVAP